MATRTRPLQTERAGTWQKPGWSLLLSSMLVVVAGVASAISALNPGIFRDPAMTAGNARGTALVMLLVAVPLLLGSMIMAARGSTRAGIVRLGAIGYLLYNSVLFSFSVSFNRLFLLYVATFGLALWSLVALLIEVRPSALRERFSRDMPVRAIAAYLLLSAFLFLLAWMRDIVPALVDNNVPNSLDKTVMLTNPIEVMDLSISFPLLALAAVWLWRRNPWGYLLSGLMLVMFTIETLGTAVDQYFGHRSDPSQSLGAVPLMVALTVVGLVMTIVYMRHLHNGTV